MIRARIWQVRHNLRIGNVLHLYDNARPHTRIKTRETITLFGRNTLPHPSNSPDLASSDYHLFGSLKKSLWGKQYASDAEVKTAVMKWLKEQSIEFYEAWIHSLIRKSNITIDGNGDYIEKDGCDSHWTSFNFSALVIIQVQKKKALLFYSPTYIF